MVEPAVHQALADYASLNKNDVTLDIGAGFGFLTCFLADRCKHVVAVEKDIKIAGVLRDRVKSLPNVEVIEGNVLKVPLTSFNKVVSIPPYRISSRLLVWLFSTAFDCGVLIFQKEFADRLVAGIGSDEYGWLTVLCYYYFDVELLDTVPKHLFHPQPEVDSIIVRLKPRSQPSFEVKDEHLFKQLVQSLFTQRNKKLRNAAQSFLKGIRKMDADNAAKTADWLPFHDRRVRELAPEDFGVLANALVE